MKTQVVLIKSCDSDEQFTEYTHYKIKLNLNLRNKLET